MAEQTPAFDYGTAIPQQRLYQSRSVPSVDWAEGLFMAWNIWQRGDGRRVNVELVGLDDSNVGGPWQMREGRIDAVHLPQTVLVDELYCDALGVHGVGENFEMIGERAIVGGIARGIRTFTASPFIFTSIKQAIRYDKRYRDDEITYVLARCAPGANIRAVQAEMRQRIPHVEVLTSREFSIRSVQYWMLQTGIGITVVITAGLGLGVGTAIISQTLFAITQDHLPNYATLLALGFRRSSLVAIVLVQSLMLGGAGVAAGSALFFPACAASARTPIPLETTPLVFGGLVAVSLLACVMASFISVRSIFRIDPVSVFRQ
jgi:putative ABC transport system permease protein